LLQAAIRSTAFYLLYCLLLSESPRLIRPAPEAGCVFLVVIYPVRNQHAQFGYIVGFGLCLVRVFVGVFTVLVRMDVDMFTVLVRMGVRMGMGMELFLLWWIPVR